MRQIIKKVKAFIPIISFILDSLDGALDMWDQLQAAKQAASSKNPYAKTDLN